jgi:hypothetical protein
MPSGHSQAGKARLLRVLSEKSVWVELWGSVKRVHKDRRARRRLGFLSLAIGLLILVVIAVTMYLAALIGTGAIFVAPFVIPVLWWLRRSARKEFQPIRITPPWSRRDSMSEKAGSGKLRGYFADLTLLYAVLVDRAGSERFLKEKELPPGMEVTSRRMQMEVLRTFNMWDRVSLDDREAIMMPDGAWDWGKINIFATGIEPLRLLRWILRLDFRLPPIGQQLSGDFSIAHEIVVDPHRLRRGSDLIEDGAVRVSRDDAHNTLLRCVAESISRGYQVAEDEKTAAWAKQVSEELSGNQHEDFLLGDELVSEANRERLAWATALSNIRTEFLSRVLELLDTGRSPEGPLETMFAQEDERVPDPQ